MSSRVLASYRAWRAVQTLLLALAIGWFAGCATSPTVQQQVAERALLASSAAQQLEMDGEKFAALQQWLIVDVLEPTHPSARTEIARLQEQLANEAAAFLLRAKTARKKRRHRTARKLLLQGLAAQPDHPEILRLLRQREMDRQSVALKAGQGDGGSSRATAAAAIAAQPSVPVDAALREAEVIYQQAIDAIENDREQARLLFEKVLAIEPTHLGARAYLDILRQ